MSFLNLTSVTETSFEPIPIGTYTANLVDAEVKETKSGTGGYISVKFKIIDGDHEGRTFFDMFNIKNNNPTAVSIGLSQLKGLMKAAGSETYQINSVAELCGYVVDVNLTIQKSEEYGDRNKVKKYLKASKEMKPAPIVDADIPF